MRIRLPSDNELLVLRLLRYGAPEMYGLEMVKASGGTLRPTSVYVTLRRMEAKGFVESRTPTGDDNPGAPRPRYKITALGERMLRAADAAQVVIGTGLARVQAR
ncbi:MAG: PadR family transcriptional regulator [Steroidobacteraceae bacterium]|jgi:DNA-binding PadR family transcriptional regulator